MDADREVREVARAQHGVVGDDQAREAGLDHRGRSRRRTGGAFERMGDRAYVLAGVPLTERARAMAAVLDVRGRSYLSHTSAAWLWGVPGFDLEVIHVARRFEGTRRPSKLARIHNLRGVPDDHLGELDGIPVASPVLTCFQVAAVASLPRTERAVDNVLVLGLARPPAFHDLLGILAGRGRNGIRTMRTILADRPPDHRPPESGNERRFDTICREHGLVMQRQVEIGTDDHFVTRVDFRDPEFTRIVYRIQSARWHGAVSHVRDDDAQRDALAPGFTVVDIWDRDLWRNPNRVITQVLDARRNARLGR